MLIIKVSERYTKWKKSLIFIQTLNYFFTENQRTLKFSNVAKMIIEETAEEIWKVERKMIYKECQKEKI